MSEPTPVTSHRTETMIAGILNLLDKIPNYIPLKGDVYGHFQSLQNTIIGMRPPRIMIMGRCKSGKSSLINAICGMKVAEVSQIEPQTGQAQWKEYYNSKEGTEVINILDTRGLQEAQNPQEHDNAKTPKESIVNAIKKDCPDIILFIRKATDVSIEGEDIENCEDIYREIEKNRRRKLPIIGVITKCDELAPNGRWGRKTEQEKQSLCDESIEMLRQCLNKHDILRTQLKQIVPTVADVDYIDDRMYCEIDPENDFRWNIDKLINVILRQIPAESQPSFVRMARVKDLQKGVARTFKLACVGICGAIGTIPIPGIELPAVGTIQIFMISFIAYAGGQEFSDEIAGDFLASLGIGVGTNLTFIALANSVLKLIPGFGSVVSAASLGIATEAIGEAAISFFIDQSPTAAVKQTFQDKINEIKRKVGLA